jgi:anti-sigma B factor antagonist
LTVGPSAFPLRGTRLRNSPLSVFSGLATIRALLDGVRGVLTTAFTYRVDRDTDSVTIHLGGEVDLAAAPRVESAIDEALAAEEGVDITIDLDGVTFLDSTGLRVLMAAHARCASEGRSLTLVNPSTAVSRILEITGLGETLLADG